MDKDQTQVIEYSKRFFSVIGQHLAEIGCTHSILEIAMESDLAAGDQEINNQTNWNVVKVTNQGHIPTHRTSCSQEENDSY